MKQVLLFYIDIAVFLDKRVFKTTMHFLHGALYKFDVTTYN